MSTKHTRDTRGHAHDEVPGDFDNGTVFGIKREDPFEDPERFSRGAGKE